MKRNNRVGELIPARLRRRGRDNSAALVNKDADAKRHNIREAVTGLNNRLLLRFGFHFAFLSHLFLNTARSTI